MNRVSIAREQGFTLVELILVLLIIALLTGGGQQLWQGVRLRLRLAETATQLHFFLSGVREYANRTNRDLSLNIIAIGNGWCVDARPASAMPPCRGQGRLVWLAPYPDIGLLAVRGEPGFYGRRNVARAGSIDFGSAQDPWRLIISSRARIRLCQPKQGNCG